MSDRPVIMPEDCPEPFWHKTHRYCPRCSYLDADPELFDKDSKHYWKARAELAEAALAQPRKVTDAQRKLDAIAALPRYHVEGVTGLPLTVVYARDVDAIFEEPAERQG